MSSAKKLKAHPYAELFPMMNEAEAEALAADIAEVGLRQPIVLYQGAILDGRNRYAACEKAGVVPQFTEFEGDEASALALVKSLNLQRRDLTQGQRGIVAARCVNLDTALTRKARKEIAAEFKISETFIQYARALLSDAPDLASQVETCTTSLAKAYEELQARRKQSEQKARDAAKVREYKDAIDSGEMSQEEALQRAMEQEREEKEKTAALANARSCWLKELVQFLSWVKTFVAQRSDEHLAWYTEPDSPGLFDHGIDSQQVAECMEQLERIKTHTFGGPNGKESSGKSKRQQGR